MEAEPNSAAVTFACTQCGNAITTSPDQSGQTVTCSNCQASLMTPPSDHMEQKAPIAITTQEADPAAVTMPDVTGTFFGSLTSESVAAPEENNATPAQPSPSLAPAPELAPLEPQLQTAQAIVSAPVAQEIPPAPTEAPSIQAPAPSSSAPTFSQSEPATKSRLPVYMLAGLTTLGVLAFVGITISNNIAHAELLKEIETQVAGAYGALNEGDPRKAQQLSQHVQKLMLSHMDEFEVKQTDGWQKQLREIEVFNKRLTAIDDLIAQGQQEPTKLKNELQRKRLLFDEGEARVRPLLEKIDRGLIQAVDWEREAFLAELRKETDAAEGTLIGGDIAAASKAAHRIKTRMAGSLNLEDQDLEKRLARVIDYEKRQIEAQGFRASAPTDFESAKKKLNFVIEGLKASDEMDRPLLQESQKLLSEVVEIERKALKLGPDDLEALSKIASTMAAQDPGIMVGIKTANEGIQLRFESLKLALGMVKKDDASQLVLISQEHRFPVSEKNLTKRPGQLIRIVQSLGLAMQKADIQTGYSWKILLDAPQPVAYRHDEGVTQTFFDSQLFTGPKKDIKEKLQQGLDHLIKVAKALELAMMADTKTPKKIRDVVIKLIQGTYQKLGWHEHLPTHFSRKALQDNYIENNVPGAGLRLKSELEAFRSAYKNVIGLRATFDGKDKAENTLTIYRNAESHRVIRRYAKAKDETFFAIKHPLKERPLLYINYTFKGQHPTLPESLSPLTVQMSHPSIGIISSYEWKTGIMDSNPDHWAQASRLTKVTRRSNWRGQPEWEFPPHVFLVDQYGNPKGIVTSKGRVGMPRFDTIKDEAKRKEAKSKYLRELAKVLYTTGHLNLYYLYFHQYVLDSPIVTSRNLLGSRTQCGDIHQTVFESLDRKLGGRYIGDCDDLAELFMNLTRKQGKNSFVMAVPGHATCGWVEKHGASFRMQFLDTGPPRIFNDHDIEKLVETSSRSYDQKGTMRFDPKSLGYLFRFAGEATRTPYYLSTRMFVDPTYAKIMERVQGYWHFHFYALGIKTMEKMIADGDRVPENCTELAGLYGRVREHEKAIKWTRVALGQLGPRDTLSRLSELFRIGADYREAEKNEDSYEAVQPAIKILKQLYKSQESNRVVSQRLSMASLLTSIERPWEAWDLLRQDAFMFAKRGFFRMAHASNLTGMYQKMTEMIKEKNLSPNAKQQTAMAEIKRILDWFYKVKIFRPDDDFNDILHKYAVLGMYYSIQQPREKTLAALLKDGPYPVQERKHLKRPASVSSDWQWIRLSPLSYSMEIGKALDPDKPASEWRKDDAIKLSEAMFRATKKAQRFGSLGSTAFMVTTTRVTHAFLTKNWKALEDILKEVKHENYARLTAAVASTIGGCARFVTPKEFLEQFKLLEKYTDTKAPYFNAVYEAYRADGFEHARLAAKEAVIRWKDDENMKREAQFLEELITHRIKEKAKQKKSEAPLDKKKEEETKGSDALK